ncbi:hypothetical protein C0995_002386 [Termitomyces sp. Mi166|nr:hypothetical protein C0995_002386 [Termitomyces sp. Mi166\
MPRSKLPTCGQQPMTTGLGKQSTSPIKRGDKSKTTTHVRPIGKQLEIARLRAKVAALKKQAEGRVNAPPENIAIPEPFADDGPDIFDDLLPSPECITLTQDERPLYCIAPNQTAKDLYANWTNLLTQLVTPLLEYTSTLIGNVSEQSLCLTVKTDFLKFSVEWCNCEELPYVLIANRLFLTTPSYPHMAISVHLLDFYCALFERLCNAINAMARALNAFYAERGFIVMDKKIHLQQQLDAAILNADTRIQDSPITQPSYTALFVPSPTTLLLPSGSPFTTAHLIILWNSPPFHQK